MNEQLAGLLGTLVNKNQGYEQSYLPVGFYDMQPVEPEPLPSVTTDLQIQEAVKRSVQQPIVGKASYTSPIRQEQSVGGSATSPSGFGSATEIKGGYKASNGLWYASKDDYLYSKDNPKYSGDWIDNPNATTAFQVSHYLTGAVQGMQAISAIANGYVSAGQYRMRANNMEYLARQNERNAQNALKNIREIDRAAQHDMGVLSEMNIKRKSEQRIAQAASGFAVGRGSYKVLSDNTDWKTNFNASMIALKAGLQGAEVIRQAGGLEAQAIINRSEAEIARKNAKMARTNGWIAGIAGLAQAGASFYIGSVGSD